MAQLTIRGFDKELERRIRELAESEGLSLNQAALKLLRKATGLEGEGLGSRGRDCIGAALDSHIGTWSAEQAEELLEHVRDFEAIDDETWS